MNENKQFLNAVKEVIDRFGMTRKEVKEEGIPEALFEILSSQTYLPVNSIKQEWLEEKKIFKQPGNTESTVPEPETYSEEQMYYVPSEDFLKELFE